MYVPEWFVKLHYEGCAEEIVRASYQSYLDHREEGYSKQYILVCVLGLADPAY
jgi:hypothetical protein